MEKLLRRKWKPVVCKDTNKWFTGYQGDLEYKTTCCELVDQDHEAKILHLTPCGMSRGRSAGTFEFKDDDDFTYTMSMSGTYALLTALAAGLVTKSEKVYAGWEIPCVQTKQGANYFIEVFFIGE